MVREYERYLAMTDERLAAERAKWEARRDEAWQAQLRMVHGPYPADERERHATYEAAKARHKKVEARLRLISGAAYSHHCAAINRAG